MTHPDSTGPLSLAAADCAGVATRDAVSLDGCRWERLLLRTRWLTESDDLGAILDAAAAAGPPRPEEVLAVAEKAVVVTSARAVPASAVVVGPLATLLARGVHPVGNSRGLSVPAKMQYVLDHAGRPRVLLAAAAAAVTRRWGGRGTFYRLAGPLARDIDGMRGAYADRLLPPLLPGEAALLAHHLAVRLGRPVAVVDVNDRGGSVRGTSAGAPPAQVLLDLLRDNPLGHCEQSTPAVLLRPLSGPATARPGPRARR